MIALCCVGALLLAACGDADIRASACAAQPTAPDDANALGYAFLARMRVEGQIEEFRLLAGARDDRTAYAIDGGRGCVAFTGVAPDIRVGVETADPRLERHVRDEATSEGVGTEPYALGR